MYIQQDVPLAQLSTFNIGGNAREFIEVKTPEGLIEVTTWAKQKDKKYKIFAGGSNVLFPDEGIDVLVIRIIGGSIKTNNSEIVCDAGVLLSDLVTLENKKGLKGVEKLVGIPGTVGGAVVGNAGAYGAAISDHLKYLQVWDGKCVKKINKKECGFLYRESIFKHNKLLVLRVVFALTPSETSALQKTSREILTLRLAKYKPGLKCPGSFFKNIPVKLLTVRQLKKIGQDYAVWGKVPAGYLLDQIGARGMQVGNIRIADFHGNLFVNEGKGTAKDVKKLATVLKKRVSERFRVELEEEIRYL